MIPAFLSLLEQLDENNEHADVRAEIGMRVSEAIGTDGHDYWVSDIAQEDLDTLFDLLDSYSPEGAYFGANEGDGASFGFWPCEDDPEDESDDYEFILDDAGNLTVG